MKLFLLGDFETDGGPGRANREIKKSLEDTYPMLYSKGHSLIGRVFELIWGICKCDIAIICSKSRINQIAFKIAKLLGKKLIYLMHGCSVYEAQIQNPGISAENLGKLRTYEEEALKSADCVLCVSKLAEDLVKEEYPAFRDKIDHIYNVVEFQGCPLPLAEEKSKEKAPYEVISVGGGMRQKNNLVVAQAIEDLRTEGNRDVMFTIVGAKKEYGDQLAKYDFVDYIDHMEYSQLMKRIAQSDLYIQNSIFETFGLTILEALRRGTNILISKNCGCVELFSDLQEEDLICDVNDREEVKRKIRINLETDNNERLRSGFRQEFVTHQAQLESFEKIFGELKR